MKLHEFIGTLMHEQEVVVADYGSGKTYIKNRNARSTMYLLEYNGRLRDSKICFVEDEIDTGIMHIYILKD